MFGKLKRYLKNPYYALGYDMIKKCPKLMTDRFYLKVLWKMLMGYELNLENPVTFNEKLQWLKLYDRNPLYTTLVDKYRVKQWVADRIGAEHVIPTLAVYKSVDEIDLDKLPSQFVLKCNHDSGSVAVCRDKSTFDIETAKKKLGEALKRNFYWEAREWPYKNVKPLIFAEKYMEDIADDTLTDYKWFTFHGDPKIMYISHDRGKKPYTNFFDKDFNALPIRMLDPNSNDPIERPACFEQMKELVKKLADKFPQVRVDFYLVDEKVYFGEFTFYHNGGFFPVSPAEWNKILGDWILLPNANKKWRGGVFAKQNLIIRINNECSAFPKDLLTYKFLCFNGEPKIMYITVKNDDIWENYYDMDFKQMNISRGYRISHHPIAKSNNFEKMKQLARCLSKDIPFVRIDMYEINSKIYFSECTFYDWAGLAPFKNNEIEISLGREIKI